MVNMWYGDKQVVGGIKQCPRSASRGRIIWPICWPPRTDYPSMYCIIMFGRYVDFVLFAVLTESLLVGRQSELLEAIKKLPANELKVIGNIIKL